MNYVKPLKSKSELILQTLEKLSVYSKLLQT